MVAVEASVVSVALCARALAVVALMSVWAQWQLVLLSQWQLPLMCARTASCLSCLSVWQLALMSTRALPPTSHVCLSSFVLMKLVLMKLMKLMKLMLMNGDLVCGHVCLEWRYSELM